MPSLETVNVDEFNQRLKNKAKSLKIPYEAVLELTYACNLRCVHCYNPTHKATSEELSSSDFKKVIDQLAVEGCMLLLISGGEPFARPDIFDLLQYAKTAGLQLVINTNATLLTQDKINLLNEIGPNLLAISVYGMTREVYESVTNVTGSFEKFFSALDLLKAHYRHTLLFKMPLLTLNLDDLASARTYFSNWNQRFLSSAEIHPRVSGELSPLNYRLSAEQAAEFRLEFDDKSRCGGYGVLGSDANPSHRLFDCQCGKNACAISPYGEMNLCVTTPFPKYSLKTGSVKEGWHVLVNFVDSVEPTELHECPKCDLYSYCTQGAMDAYLNAGDFNVCLPYYKETAMLVKSKRVHQ